MRGPSPGLVRGLALGAAVLTVVAAVAVVVLVGRGTAERDHRFVIPEGTAEQIEAGDDADVLPDELVVAEGDTLTVVNDDVADHYIGVLRVPAGETASYQFPDRGQYESYCTVHRTGAVDIIVE